MKELNADQLYCACDPALLEFETTAELEDLDAIVGQERAVEAIRFGIGIDKEGFNLFAMGPSGIGKHHVIDQFLHERAPSRPTPDDWIYVHNFEEPRYPIGIRMKAGRARDARARVDQMITDLELTVQAVFENEEFRARRRAIHHEFDQRHEDALQALAEDAREYGVALSQTSEGFVVAPMIDGEIVGPEALDAMPTDEREQVEAAREHMQRELRELLDELPRWDRARREALQTLERTAVEAAVAEVVERVAADFGDALEFVEHLDRVLEDVLDDPSIFLPEDEDERPRSAYERLAAAVEGVDRYRVNVIVDHSESEGAPIIYEDDPTVENLIGRIEYEALFGALVTNFSLIRAGALHDANGGYLVVDARKLLSDPAAWELLKRTLYAHEIRIDSGRESQATTLSLSPDPIPLDVKVILVGERSTYYALREYDPDMDELFKVMADFDTEMDRTPQTVATYARLLATVARRDGLKPLDRTAVARVIEHSARFARDSRKLSTHMRAIADLLRESDYWSKGEVITAGDVQFAIDAQDRRNGRVHDTLAEQMTDGILVIPTSGQAVGRINGLSVLMFGQSSFGRPTRISATVAPGRGELTDIEREVELGGPIHSKGVLILRGYLASSFATDFPLSLSASVVFEQSYSEVDGDSASLAELCAILSAIAQIPIRQSVAVTGAVDQYGAIRAVGGLNEKIEGFFELCAERGLDGSQGVVMPTSNAPELMLRFDVVTAVREAKFHIWTADTIDEVLELTTGLSATKVRGLVEERLRAFAASTRLVVTT